ncbi:MAG: TonB-dependent receptor [Pseudomonadota bacterium]
MSVYWHSTLVSVGLLAFACTSTAASQAIEEITVTASKREQTLQQTAIAVSVVGKEEIERSMVLDLHDLQVLVPSLRIETGNRSVEANYSIRGFGNGGSAPGTEPAVGVFIDGVFRSRSTATVLDLPRLERVEVLRGPQNTLFGKNASAGVISIITPKPAFEPSSSVEATVGRFDQRVVKGYWTGAVSERLALSLSGTINKRDGFAETPLGLDNLNEKNRLGVRMQALYEPSDTMSFRLIADYSEMDESCCVTGNVQTGGTEPIIVALGGKVRSDSADNFTREGFINFNQENKLEDSGLSFHADFAFEGFSLTSITAYRNNHRGPVRSDTDYTTLDIAGALNERKIRTFSQEVRLTSMGDGSLEWMLGAFLFNEDISDNGNTIYGEDLREYAFRLVGGNLDGTGGPLGALETALGLEGQFFNPDIIVGAPSSQDNLAFSIFGNLDYALTDAITLSAGVNYTKDDKDVWFEPNVPIPDVFSALDLTTAAGGAFAGLRGLQFRPPSLGFPNAVEDGKTSDSDTTWLARVAWDINDNLNLYISAATGFKSSSWVIGDSNPFRSDQAAIEAAGIATSNQQYGARYSTPEYAEVYEIGLKARFDYGQVYLTYFDQSIEDFQTRAFDGVNFIATNAGKLSADGFEVEALFRPTENWQFSLSGTWLDPIYEDFRNAPGPFGGPRVIDRSGTRPGGIHDLSAVAVATYNFSFGIADGFARMGYLYEHGTGLDDTFPNIEREVGTLNASIGLDFNNGITAQLWGRNINDDKYFTGGFNGVAQGGTVNSRLSEPPTYGLTVRYRVN